MSLFPDRNIIVHLKKGEQENVEATTLFSINGVQKELPIAKITIILQSGLPVSVTIHGKYKNGTSYQPVEETIVLSSMLLAKIMLQYYNSSLY